MKKSPTFNVELSEFAAQLIVWVMRSDTAEERAFDYIDSELPDDADTAGLTREEYVSALLGRLTDGVIAIENGLLNSKNKAS